MTRRKSNNSHADEVFRKHNTKDPSVQAFTNLLNRALDKPAEEVQVAGADGGPIQIQWLRPDEPPLELDSNVIVLEAHEPESDSQD